VDSAVDTTVPMPEKQVGTVGKVMRKTSRLLTRSGILATMIASLLFCVLMAVAWLAVMQLLALLRTEIQLRLSSFGAILLLDGIYWLLGGVLFLLFVAPFFWGRLHLAGRVCLGESPLLREMLHYYTSWRRLGRSVLISLVLALELLIPLTLVLGAFGLSFFLYSAVFWELFLYEWVARLLLILCLVFSALFSLLVFMIASVFALSTAFAVGNEELPLSRAVALAFRRGIGRFGSVCLFTLRSLWHLLLSLCTVGVLHLLWYGHHYIISYLCLAMALDQGEKQL